MLLLIDGQWSDHCGAALILPQLPPAAALMADHGYAGTWFRAAFADRGIAACIPATRSRKKSIPHDAALSRQRHRIEIMSAGLKGRRRIATRYDRCPHLSLAAVTLAAIVLFWLLQ